MNLSSINLPLIFNVSVLVTTLGEENQTFDKVLTVYLKDKRDFNLTLSDNKVKEKTHQFVNCIV